MVVSKGHCVSVFVVTVQDAMCVQGVTVQVRCLVYCYERINCLCILQSYLPCGYTCIFIVTLLFCVSKPRIIFSVKCDVTLTNTTITTCKGR